MKKFYAYARVSTVDQSDHSIEHQLEYLRLKAEDLNLLFEPYSEKVSAKNLEDRPELNKILAVVQEGDYVGFYDNSRFGRDTAESLTIIEDFTRKGVNVQIGGKTFDKQSPREELLFTIESAISTFYRKEQRLKSEIGIKLKKQHGEWIFTSKLYGYLVKTENGKPVVSIVKAEADVLNFIFTEYSKGSSIRDITDRLNKKGLRTREGKKFHAATVRRYILKPIYKGYYLVEGAGPTKGQEQAEYIEENLVKSKFYSPIISKELWDSVHKSYRTVTRTHSKQYEYRWSAYELTGILRCYHCKQVEGKSTGYVHSFSKAHEKDYENYVNRVHVDGCKQTFHTFRADILEKLFEQCFFLLFMNDMEFTDFIELKTKGQVEEDVRVREDIKQLQEFIKKIETKRKNFLAAIANGANQEHIIPELNKLDEEEAELKAVIDECESLLNMALADMEDVSDLFKDNALEKFVNLEPKHKRRIFKDMIQSAWVFNKQLVIRFWNSKLFIIPLEKHKGRYVQTVFDVKTYFKNQYQSTFRYEYNDDELTLVDVPYNKDAWKDMPDGFIGHHRFILDRLKNEINRYKAQALILSE